MYDSKQNLIYQTAPLSHKPSSFRNKGWTESVQGYLREASKLTTLLFRNSLLIGHQYTWFITIYTSVPISETNNWWAKATRNLRRKDICGIWVREPTRSNKVHYHILLTSKHTKKQLLQIVETCLPSRTLYRWHKRLQPVDDSYYLLHYITKAKVAGRDKHGVYKADLFGDKRLLFKPKLGIRKCGTIGQFWHKSKSEIWSDIRETEKRISEGLERKAVVDLCSKIHDYLGGTISLKRIQRSYGAHWNSLPVKTILSNNPCFFGQWQSDCPNLMDS